MEENCSYEYSDKGDNNKGNISNSNNISNMQVT